MAQSNSHMIYYTRDAAGRPIHLLATRKRQYFTLPTHNHAGLLCSTPDTPYTSSNPAAATHCVFSGCSPAGLNTLDLCSLASTLQATHPCWQAQNNHIIP
jgi:hypothetical protein